MCPELVEHTAWRLATRRIDLLDCFEAAQIHPAAKGGRDRLSIQARGEVEIFGCRSSVDSSPLKLTCVIGGLDFFLLAGPHPMPTRLTRMILLDILRIFVIALFVLTTLILLIAVGRELLRKGLGPMAVLQLLPFAVPISLQHAVPATALFSVCCVYGRMAADGEIATVKASGVSPLVLLRPAIVFAACLSPRPRCIAAIWRSRGASPGSKKSSCYRSKDIAYRRIASDHTYTSDHGFSIHVRDVIGRRMIAPTVTIRGKDDSPPLHGDPPRRVNCG